MTISLFFKAPAPANIKSKTKLLKKIAEETLKNIRDKNIGRFDEHSSTRGTRPVMGLSREHSLGRFDGHSPKHGTRHSLETSIIFVNAAEIKKLNKKFLKKTSITDVIAFNYPKEMKIQEPIPFGDVFVCIDQAKEQAAFYGHSLLKELAILTVHGCLHLKGMEDATKAEKAKMDKKTEFYIKKHFPQKNKTA